MPAMPARIRSATCGAASFRVWAWAVKAPSVRRAAIEEPAP